MAPIENETSDTPLEAYLKEVRRTFDNGFYHAAIMMALAIPDVCATLQSKEARSGDKNYVAWLFDNAEPQELIAHPQIVYKLRCGVSHNAFLTHNDIKKMNIERIVLTIPETKNVVHGVKFEDAASDVGPFLLDAGLLVDALLNAARRWYEKKPETSQCCGAHG